MNSGLFNDIYIAELTWGAQNYEDIPPYGDQVGMEAWDEAQAAREALMRTVRKILRKDLEVRSN